TLSTGNFAAARQPPAHQTMRRYPRKPGSIPGARMGGTPCARPLETAAPDAALRLPGRLLLGAIPARRAAIAAYRPTLRHQGRSDIRRSSGRAASKRASKPVGSARFADEAAARHQRGQSLTRLNAAAPLRAIPRPAKL